MIKRINYIKNLGVFSDYKNTQSLEFNKFNLFYGWNGSGKSTLSKLFRAIEKKSSIKNFENFEFEIECDPSDYKINQSFNTSVPNIKVFNKDFINENTQFEEGTTESILYIGKENTELKNEIIELKQNLELNNIKYSSIVNDCIEINEKINNFFIDSGKLLKIVFSATVFSLNNYNKTKAEEIWNKVKETTSLKDCLLPTKELGFDLSFISQNQKKEKLSSPFKQIETWDNEVYNNVVELISNNPVINSIKRLESNIDIAQWVLQGLTLHEKHQSNNCEYCGKKLESSRAIELTNHFNREFIDFQNKIKIEIENLKKLFIPEIVFNSDQLYPEYKDTVDDTLRNIESTRNHINQGINKYIELLNLKLSNPLSKPDQYSNIGSGNFSIYNQGVKTIEHILDLQNTQVDEYGKEASVRKEKIENHHIALRAIEAKLKLLFGQFELKEKEKKLLETTIHEQKTAIRDKEIKLENATIAIEEINENLNKFLGKKEIALEPNPKGGYNLIRNKNTALNLSEGEKTAISLIYFLSKIKEKGNDIKSTIIVFDDPISSLDSNHLFSASSLVLNQCIDAKQVFILTHNFWFFKILRDWMQNKDKNRNKEVQKPLTSYFELKNGTISYADKSLLEYHSEYHYVFKKLNSFKDNKTPSLDESFIIANTARRVLESFSTIKIPHKSGIRSILELANDKGIPKDTTEKIYYFLNKYSHLDRIENHENTIENISAESKQIVINVLNIINTVDKDHYESLQKICS